MTEQAGLYQKMVKVMAQMERIPKRGFNSHFRYDYVTDGDVLDAVRAALVAEGIAFFVSFNSAERHEKGVIGSFTLTFADTETGQTHSINWIGEGQDTQDKGSAKAATSAVKYALLKTFLISTGAEEDDPDADPAPPQRSAPRPASQQAAPQQDAWAAEEQGNGELPYIDIAEVGVFVTKSGKPHLGLMEAGHKWPDIRWWKGRDELLAVAPWLVESCTKEDLTGEARFPFVARVYYTEDDNGYKIAERFERI